MARDFVLGRGKSAVNPVGLTSILTKLQHERPAPKSGSGLNALARVVGSGNPLKSLKVS